MKIFKIKTGGSVNLNTLSALPDDRVFNLTLNTGYNNQEEEFSPLLSQGSASFGQHICSDNQFGCMSTASYNRSHRAPDNNELVYDDGEFEELQLCLKDDLY